MTHLQDPVQEPSVDEGGSTDDAVGKEEGSQGGEDGVGHGDAGVHRQVELDVRARVWRKGLNWRGRKRPEAEI